METLQIGLLVTSIIMFIIAAMFLFYYMKNRSNIEAYKKQGETYHPGSFKGWWFRNKWSTMIFLAFTFLIIGTSLIYLVII